MPSEPYVAVFDVFPDAPAPAPYTPREGDVIERGDERFVLVLDMSEHDGHIRSRRFTRRKRWGKYGPWTEHGRGEGTPAYWAALVNHMGWRLLPRGNE